MSDDRLDELDDAKRTMALRLRESLRASERVDAATTARLAQARARAVDAGGPSRPAWLWASGGVTAAAIVAALVLLLQFGGLQRWRGDGVETNPADALEVLTDDLDVDFYEDLELYRWLAEDGHA